MPDVRVSAKLTSGIYLFVIETTHFINSGYGWVCKRCSAEQEERASAETSRARFFNEGEAETKEAHLSTPAMARWTDATRQTLICPRCSIEEPVSKI